MHINVYGSIVHLPTMCHVKHAGAYNSQQGIQLLQQPANRGMQHATYAHGHH